jgi:excisionase family DNA binding protein
MKRKTRKARFVSAVYSVSEAGELLGISRNSAYAAARDGSLPVIKVGRLLKVPKAVLDKMLGAVA